MRHSGTKSMTKTNSQRTINPPPKVPKTSIVPLKENFKKDLDKAYSNYARKVKGTSSRASSKQSSFRGANSNINIITNNK